MPEFAELARHAKPKLYHYVALSPDALLSEMHTRYTGHFVISRDLDVY